MTPPRLSWSTRALLAVAFVVTVIGSFVPGRSSATEPAAPSAPVAPAASPDPDAPPGALVDEAAAKAAEDPDVIRRAAAWHAAHGNAELARTLFGIAYDKGEMALYFGKEKELRAASIDEAMGDSASAEAEYRALAKKDPLHTAMALRIQSHLPNRDALFAEVAADVRARAERAKAGEQVPIYVTSKGEDRFLEVIPPEKVLARLQEADENGEARLRYCYIDALDLTGVDTSTLAPRIILDRCVVGRVLIPNRDMGAFSIKGFVLGDFAVGKTWDGEVNTGKVIPGSHFSELSTRETVFLGNANFQDVTVSGRVARFPFTIFEGDADFRGTKMAGDVDFRFSTFAAGANFKRARLGKSVYFGHTRFTKETRFTELFSEQTVYFDSARFEAPVHFDACEFNHGASFENAEFLGEIRFDTSRVAGRVNLSRTRMHGPLAMTEVNLGGLDLFGATLDADAEFVDAKVAGKVRFSVDGVTRARHLADPAPLLGLYRDYQGDDDAAEPLATRSSYGVLSVDDLTAQVAGNLRFDNAVLNGFVIFERVVFGRPGADTTAEFYNTQFGGETHFERTTWYSTADFTTIYAEELALNEAELHRTLVLDDANVPGRVTLTDATFAPGATLSFYGAEIGSFQVAREQIEDPSTGGHRLWYGQCASGVTPVEGDVRFARSALTGAADPKAFRAGCGDKVLDEYTSLKQSFDDRSMTEDEDWAYWWIKHSGTFQGLRAGGLAGWVAFPVRFFIFELAFGWGVRLGNLAVTAMLVCLVFAWLYRRFCGDTVMSYSGDDVAIRDIPWPGLLYISLQSLGGFNTGWDFGASNTRFRYLNTAHTFLGVIILTFFVGAYTRMILA